jgi:DNA repair protein RadC
MKKPPSGKKSPGTSKKILSADEQRLRDALAPYLNEGQLQFLAQCSSDTLHQALQMDQPPPEIEAMMRVLSALLRPLPNEQVNRPSELAALLMAEMGSLRQEQLRVVCLNSQHHIQTIHTVYQGNLQTVPARPIEIFREAFRHNSAAIILAHNHASGDPTPSAADLAITRQVIAVGNLLHIPVLDHLIIGRGCWISLRETSPVFEGGTPPVLDFTPIPPPDLPIA